MRIVADAQIPLVAEAFSGLGEVALYPPRQLTRAAVADAEVLLVRSITPVDADLLAGSALRFVGTATIGEDHLDTAYLQQAGIYYASVPGCNAEAVAEYVLSALCVLAQQQNFELPARTVGIVGCGNTGSALAAKLKLLGVRVLRNDPPLAAQRGDDTAFVPLSELLASADIVSLHVPLTRTGAHPTQHLISAAQLTTMRPGSTLINTSRGAVVDNVALLHSLRSGHLRGAVLDVWEGEPRPNPALLAAVTLATPHIAGYSLMGKLRATERLYRALCEFLEQPPQWQLPPEPGQVLALGADATLGTSLLAAYDICRDDAQCRAILGLPEAERGAVFERLRKNYPLRPEYAAFSVATQTPAPLRALLGRLGFAVLRETR